MPPGLRSPHPGSFAARRVAQVWLPGAAGSALSPRPPGKECLSRPVLSSALSSPHLTPALKLREGVEGRSQDFCPSCLCSFILSFRLCTSFPFHLSVPGGTCHLPLCVAPLDSTLLSTQRRQGFASFITVGLSQFTLNKRVCSESLRE